jgi:group I intron endonuclease
MKGIYCIENKIDGKKYYGSSMNIEKRIKNHKEDLLKGQHINILLQRAVDKHGIENFDFKVVEDMGNPTRKEIHLREQTFIDANIGGYNIAPAAGGDMLLLHPNREEILRNRAERHRQWVSLRSAEERREKFAKFGEDNPNWRNGGRLKLCPSCKTNKIEPKAKTCGGCRKHSGEHNPFYGKAHTEKTKQILREKQLNKCWIRDVDPAKLSYTIWYEITYPTGEKKQVAGLKAIAKEFGVSVANVHATVARMESGKTPSKSVFKNHIIRKLTK